MSLVLTRRPHESLRLTTNAGEIITIRFESGRKVIIDAPDTVNVVRGEVYLKEKFGIDEW
jgi:sRNA-binding carbon storage regulator CsrA